MKKDKPLDLNPQFKKALELMEHTSKNIFITGKAGTGKSTLLDYFRGITKKKIVVLAPTGVAALNVLGETVHSFFGFKPNITLHKIKKLSVKRSKIYKSLDTIIIDEISMVRADLLDCVDRFLRLNGKDPGLPFGGAQIVFIGDLYQLPPVITSRERELFQIQYKNAYFFESSVFSDFCFEFVELEKIYRQKDEGFIEILNAIRNSSVTDEHFSLLNKRAAIALPKKDSDFSIYLTTTNKAAAEVNEERLSALRSKIYSCGAEVAGNFNRSSYPADEELNIAVNS
ncbi:MAG: AAA family ATPase, partial [Candidatus Omnitrophota bacterium]